MGQAPSKLREGRKPRSARDEALSEKRRAKYAQMRRREEDARNERKEKLRNEFDEASRADARARELRTRRQRLDALTDSDKAILSFDLGFLEQDGPRYRTAAQIGSEVYGKTLDTGYVEPCPCLEDYDHAGA